MREREALTIPTQSLSRSLSDPFNADRPTSFQSSFSLRRASDRGGNRLDRATVLNAALGTRSIVDAASRTDSDFFKLTLNTNRKLKLTLENRSEVNLFGAILNDRGRMITVRGDRLTGAIGPGERGTLSYDEIPPGTYYLRLTSSANGINDYKLDVRISRGVTSTPAPCGCGE